MKNQKSLSSVSDEHLVDMLDASILSYNVYVLENTKVKQHQLLEGFREEGIMEKTFALYEEKIKEINKMPSSIEQEGLLLAETRSFLIKLRENEKYKKYFDSIATNLMDNYDATYRGEEKSLDLNKITGQLVEKKTKIWDLAKSDASILIDREVCLFLMKKYRMRKDSTFFKYLEKSTDGKGELVYKNTLEVEKDYESAFKINEQKIMLVAKDRMQDMIPVTSYHIGRHNPSYVKSNLGEWNHLYTDEKGIFLVGNPREDIGASFSAFLREEKGETVLHIGFRGTDTNAKDMMDYVTKDYLNMERQFNEIEPIIKEIIEISKKQYSQDKPFKIKLSGHSLGGAMVEKFLEKNKNTNEYIYSGVAIASPGALNKAQGLVNALDKISVKTEDHFPSLIASGIKLINNGLVGTANVAIGLTSGAIRTSKNVLNVIGEKTRTKSFTNLGIKAIEFIFPYKDADERLINVNHKNDLVPQLGSLANRVQKDEIQLYAINSEEAHKNHKIYNYYNEIAQEVLKRPQLTKELVDVFAVEEAFKRTPYITASKHHEFLQQTMQFIGAKVKGIKKSLLENEDINPKQNLKI